MITITEYADSTLKTGVEVIMRNNLYSAYGGVISIWCYNIMHNTNKVPVNIFILSKNNIPIASMFRTGSAIMIYVLVDYRKQGIATRLLSIHNENKKFHIVQYFKDRGLSSSDMLDIVGVKDVDMSTQKYTDDMVYMIHTNTFESDYWGKFYKWRSSYAPKIEIKEWYC